MKHFAVRLHDYNNIEPSCYSCLSVFNGASVNTKHPLPRSSSTSWHLHFTIVCYPHICSTTMGFRNGLNRLVHLCIWILLLNQNTKCGQFKLSIFQKLGQKFRENFLIQTVHISVGKWIDDRLPTNLKNPCYLKPVLWPANWNRLCHSGCFTIRLLDCKLRIGHKV